MVSLCRDIMPNCFCFWKTRCQNKSNGNEIQKLTSLYCKSSCCNAREMVKCNSLSKSKVGETEQNTTKWNHAHHRPKFARTMRCTITSSFSSPIRATIFTCQVPEQRQGTCYRPDIQLFQSRTERGEPCKSCGLWKDYDFCHLGQARPREADGEE